MKRPLALLLAAAAIAAGVLLWLFRPAPPSPAARPGPTAGRFAAGSAAAPPAGAAARAAEEPSHLADGLNSPSADIHADLRILDEIFRQYRSSTRGLNPTGENREITAALAGRNRIGFAFLSPRHPAINADGELCDRWGTPFFFHQLSGTQMEIRSAGPDRKLWTADDEVLGPELNAPPR